MLLTCERTQVRSCNNFVLLIYFIAAELLIFRATQALAVVWWYVDKLYIGIFYLFIYLTPRLQILHIIKTK